MALRLKRRAAVLLPALGLAAGWVSGAYAADNRAGSNQPDTAAAASEQQAQRAVHELRASRLIGMDVRNARGEDLGEIDDLILDVNHRRVHYAVLSFGGFMGLGDKRFAYPLRTFQAAPDGGHLVLNVPKEALKAAPGFDRGTLLDWNDPKYRGEVDRYFGETVRVEARPNMMLRPARGLLDAHITNLEGAGIGDVEDIVIDMGNGQVRYVVVDLEDEWLPDQRLAILPLQALKVTPERNDVTLMLDKAVIATAPTFAEDRWPDFSHRATRNQLDRDLAGLARMEPGEDQAQNR